IHVLLRVHADDEVGPAVAVEVAAGHRHTAGEGRGKGSEGPDLAAADRFVHFHGRTTAGLAEDKVLAAVAIHVRYGDRRAGHPEAVNGSYWRPVAAAEHVHGQHAARPGGNDDVVVEIVIDVARGHVQTALERRWIRRVGPQQAAIGTAEDLHEGTGSRPGRDND